MSVVSRETKDSEETAVGKQAKHIVSPKREVHTRLSVAIAICVVAAAAQVSLVCTYIALYIFLLYFFRRFEIENEVR